MMGELTMHVVQIASGTSRRVALVKEPVLKCLEGVSSLYELAMECVNAGASLTERIGELAVGEPISYDEVYEGRSEWKLMAPIDVPGAPSRLQVAGTGLTHIGSAKERQAMHLADQPKTDAVVTDSMRMFQWGVEQGRPEEGKIGVAPEWFYKGDGSMVRQPFEALEIPGHAEDGGEEGELAGIYLIDKDGTPVRLGFVVGNEFSDHKFEKRNYLNLAGSKLRACSIGPELVIGGDFRDVQGEVRLERDGATLWERKIASGEVNMCHSLANLEHHHFKFSGHCHPGSVHVHFFGANALSFGAGIEMKDGDVAEIRFEGYGRPLRNPIREEARMTEPVRVRAVS
jgi:hypothetical protein